ncbi:MAG TPA: NAD-dependent epimerase/dehydratase family protein [Vicinamibacterales bacterium]
MRQLAHAGVTLVTGGTGLIGGEVMLALARRGEAVRAVVRAASAAHARVRTSRSGTPTCAAPSA